MGYAEALYIPRANATGGGRMGALSKGNRNDIAGKTFIGKTDSLLSDGTANQVYTPLWWRTYRYIRLVVKPKQKPWSLTTCMEPLRVTPLWHRPSSRPPTPKWVRYSTLAGEPPGSAPLKPIWIAPYYEQLQYIGDARTQALVSLYYAGDDRLVRYGLTLMDHSRIAEGITLSRYPTDLHQQIPTFSLWWVAMLHDYFMYRPDSLFIKDKLPGTRQVLSFSERYQQPDGSLKNVPYWVFTDWTQGKGWNFGMAPIGANGESAVLDMQLLWTYRLAAELENKMGLKVLARQYINRAEQLKKTIQRKYWNGTRNLYADTEAKDTYSQHANSLAILSGISAADQVPKIAGKMLTDTTLAPASIYFKFYLHQALVKAGLGDNYLTWLGKCSHGTFDLGRNIGCKHVAFGLSRLGLQSEHRVLSNHSGYRKLSLARSAAPSRASLSWCRALTVMRKM